METEAPTSTESRQPAPGELRLVQLLVNSSEPDIGREDIPDAAALGRWLVKHDLLAPAEATGLGEADRQRILTLREAVRDLLGTNAGEPLDPGSAAVIQDETCRASLKVCIAGDGGVALGPAYGGVDGAVARVLAAIAAASIAGTWRRLKACRDDTCRWAFYDSSRNASSAWCSMAVCGNRAKARRHRERKRAAG